MFKKDDSIKARKNLKKIYKHLQKTLAAKYNITSFEQFCEVMKQGHERGLDL